MIKTNKRLNLIDEYKPSNRTFDSFVKKLDWNECNLPLEKEFEELLIYSISKINLTEYPNINNETLLNKLSEYCNIDSNKIQIFNGSDSALHYIFASFLNFDSKVLIFYPNYNQIETYIKLYSDNIKYSKILEPFTKHKYNFEDIIDCDLIYISNPNNPTGYCLEPTTIESLLKKYPNKLFIVDEAYFEFSKKTCVPLVKNYENIIVTRTFSKAFSLASIRLGYICASENLIKPINKIRNTKEVNSFAQKLAEVALENINIINLRTEVIKNNRIRFEQILKDNNIEFIKSDSNFILIKVKDSERIINDLLIQKILVRDRSMFSGFENTIRITVGEWDDMEKIINTILD
jgi:histidinol-phosphate aminotransferase